MLSVFLSKGSAFGSSSSSSSNNDNKSNEYKFPDPT